MLIYFAIRELSTKLVILRLSQPRVNVLHMTWIKLFSMKFKMFVKNWNKAFSFQVFTLGQWHREKRTQGDVSLFLRDM